MTEKVLDALPKGHLLEIGYEETTVIQLFAMDPDRVAVLSYFGVSPVLGLCGYHRFSWLKTR